MQIAELDLDTIDIEKAGTITHPMVVAVAYATRKGYGPWTARRFVAALVLTNSEVNTKDWAAVLKRVVDLQIEGEIAALETGHTVQGETHI